MDKNRIFARNIRFLRKAAGLATVGYALSQRELADSLGITRRTVIIWESGQLPHKPNLGRLSSFFSEKLGVEIGAEDIVGMDLTGHLEYMPFSNLERKMSPAQRRILSSLLLSARELTEEKLKKVVDYIESLKKL